MRVLIAGAGPAGSSLAVQLAEAGWAVTLVDALPSPARNAYSSAALPLAEADRLGIAGSCRSASWWGWQLLDPNGLQHQWWAVEQQGVVLDFALFRTHLWDRARQHGVELLNGCRVTLDRLKAQSADVILVSADETQLRTVDLVVDATGPGRHLQRQAGVAIESRDDSLLSGDGVEWLLQGDPRSTAPWRDRLTFMLGRHWMAHGYGWVFPMAHDQLKVGVCRLPPPHADKVPLGSSLQRLLHRCGLDQLPVLDRHGGRVASTIRRRQPLGAGALWAVGDAASTANLLGGEGIRHAMDSASVLSKCLLTQGSHQDYQVALQRRFGWRWTVSNRLARKTWWGLNTADGDRRITRLIHGLSGQASAEDLSSLLFEYRFERYGWRLLPYLV